MRHRTNFDAFLIPTIVVGFNDGSPRRRLALRKVLFGRSKTNGIFFIFRLYLEFFVFFVFHIQVMGKRPNFIISLPINKIPDKYNPR